jgi:CRP-like cAMP-binding protein
MEPHPSAADLARVPLFHELSPDALAVLAARFEVESFDVGRTIVAEGRSGYAFYVLAEGVATVTVDGEPVRTLGPGDHFGEIAILDDDGRRTATVTATEPVVAWSLFGTAFRVLQTEHPDVADALELATRERLASDGTWRD